MVLEIEPGLAASKASVLPTVVSHLSSDQLSLGIEVLNQNCIKKTTSISGLKRKTVSQFIVGHNFVWWKFKEKK